MVTLHHNPLLLEDFLAQFFAYKIIRSAKCYLCSHHPLYFIRTSLCTTINVPVPIVLIRSKFSNLYSPGFEGASSSELSRDKLVDMVKKESWYVATGLFTGWET